MDKEKLFKVIKKKIGKGWLQSGNDYTLDDVEDAVKLYSIEVEPIKYRRTPCRIKVWK